MNAVFFIIIFRETTRGAETYIDEQRRTEICGGLQMATGTWRGLERFRELWRGLEMCAETWRS